MTVPAHRVTRAMTVEPGRAHGAAVSEVEGPVGDGDVLVEGLAVGICGTDIEIANGHYGSKAHDDRGRFAR